MVMTTVAGESAAAELARAIVDARLGACVQLLPIRSVYRWQGAIADETEQLLLIKTRVDAYEKLEAFVLERHPYDVPEIVQVPFRAGFSSYLAWIDESTSDEERPRRDAH